jgi:hypothetical protein
MLRKLKVGKSSIRKRLSVVPASKPCCLLKENRLYRPGIDYITRQHHDPYPAVSNRLYAARYELGSYRVSVYERLHEARDCDSTSISLAF